MTPDVAAPSSTYRLQFSGEFTLAQARDAVPYLDRLGIGAAYCSPLFRARSGSSHGYDVVDPSQIHPGLGTDDDYRQFARALLDRGLGVLLDIVPNHMGIDDPSNHWWQDVLANGPSSPFARCFDIDWHPPKQDFDNKVILPFLGDQFGRVLENQELRLARDEQGFRVDYYDQRLPLAPRSWRLVLRQALALVADSQDADDPDRAELESIITSLTNLPRRNETNEGRLEERRREQAVALRRLNALTASSPSVAQAVDQAIELYNGQKGDPDTFDLLEDLLANQAFRLCYWRVATDEINYRRFFDINDLAAVRVEEPRVFRAAHELMLRLMGEGLVTGLRIDHIDGLWPKAYLYDLQEACRHARADQSSTSDEKTYVLVEKILAHEEPLPKDWPTAGTTGYDALNPISGVFVERSSAPALWRIYRDYTGVTDRFTDIVYESKQEILDTSMTAELHVLSRRLDRISEQHRYSRDFTLSSLQTALSEVIACFPVYRTYIRPETGRVSDDDRRKVARAVAAAKRRNPSISETVFDFVAGVILMDDPGGLTEMQWGERHEFIRRFQQLTGPVTAKGIEDTAFYRLFPLASLNEVGGHPWHFGTSAEQFHHDCQSRLASWPLAMVASSTHDTKRGEDTRARIHVLSEIPERWREALARWQELTSDYVSDLDDEPAPDANEQYLFFQTLVGTWPLEGPQIADWPDYVDRLVAYMEKATKEAKVNTSWLHQNAGHDQAVAKFVRSTLDPGKSGQFLAEVDQFIRPLVDAGLSNALGQLLLKLAGPGVPDIYQGTEFWQFTLVDPDNRRPVDYAARAASLDESARRFADDPAGLIADLVQNRADGRIKQLVTWRCLTLRREQPDLFLHGEYLPLHAVGPAAEHIVAFARRQGSQWMVCVVPRFTLGLATATGWPLGPDAWQGTRLELPNDAPNRWRNTLTDADVDSLELGSLLNQLPIALLVGESS